MCVSGAAHERCVGERAVASRVIGVLSLFRLTLPARFHHGFGLPLSALPSLTPLARQLLERASQERPLAVHIFSNGGAFLWTRALQLSAQDPKSTALASVRGQIVDSAPGTFRLQWGWNFSWAMTRGSRPLQLLLCLLFPLLALLFAFGFFCTAQWVSSRS
eukprot:COSAG05_NODE_3353_length_2129_cov_1.951724_1_plen_160_part_10